MHFYFEFKTLNYHFNCLKTVNREMLLIVQSNIKIDLICKYEIALKIFVFWRS